ncbi:MAG: hypothetical protein ACO3UN_04630, partial [Candidatus Puniceispirillaceae bacterium]
VRGEFTFHQKPQKSDKMLLIFCELKNNFLSPFYIFPKQKIFYLPRYADLWPLFGGDPFSGHKMMRAMSQN